MLMGDGRDRLLNLIGPSDATRVTGTRDGTTIG
jgi:hypothetical protein